MFPIVERSILRTPRQARNRSNAEMKRFVTPGEKNAEAIQAASLLENSWLMSSINCLFCSGDRNTLGSSNSVSAPGGPPTFSRKMCPEKPPLSCFL